MLEGLEVTEIRLEDLKNENYTLRIDSEYYKKNFLLNIQIIKNYSSGFFKLQSAVKNITGGATPLGAEYSVKGIPFLRVQNIMQNYFSLNDVVFLSNSQNEEIKRSCLKYRDVLLTITGVSYGKSATVTKEIEGSNINQHSVKITLNNKLNPYYLSTFLNSKFGKLQSDKNIVGVTRPALDYQVIKNFNIPNITVGFQNKIEEIIKSSENKILQSQEKYIFAEAFLYETIGLKNFKPNTDPINIKTFKDSFLSSSRLDSEYYQKKYEDYEKFIKLNSLGYTLVSNEYSLVKKVSEKEKPYYNYIEIGDVNISDGSATYNLIETSDLPANAKTEVKKGDLLISKVRSNRGAVAIIDFDIDNLIVSGAFTVLREKKTSFFSNETLKVLLRTAVYKDWLLKFNIGTQYPVIQDDDIFNMPIPKIPKHIQEDITKNIQQSQKLKNQSEHLLETAKLAVEIAIEQNEEKAIIFINENSKII